MKKPIVTLLLILTLLFTCSSLALADTAPEVRVNADLVSFPDAQPFIDEANRTMMPVRFITEDMGASVTWDKTTQTATITKDGVTVEVTIGQKELKVTEAGASRTVVMDTVAVLSQDRTYVPIRFVAEALGAWVGYSDYYKTVVINDDVLTPDEIDRLQSYPSQQANVSNWPPDEYDSFDNFANAREFALRAGMTYVVESELGDHRYAPDGSGLNWGDFLGTEAAAQMSALYSYDYTTDKAASTTLDWNYLGKSSIQAPHDKADASVQHKAVIDASFITDPSCIYQDKNVAGVFHSVRGILEVTVLEPTDKAWAAKLLGLDKVEYGQQYEIDMEAKFILQVNNYTKLGTLVILEPMSGKCTINLENL